jgi:hypothetical protein
LMRFEWQRVVDEPGDLGIVLFSFVEAIDLRSHALAELEIAFTPNSPYSWRPRTSWLHRLERNGRRR